MITLCRPAYYRAHTTPMFAGLSTDTKKRPNCDGRTGRESSMLKFIGNK